MSVSSRDPRDPGRAGSSSVASIVTSASTHSKQSSSSRAHSERSHMESAVTKLLVATRQLLDSLTAWSKEKITETEVSDVYVRLGNDFNSAVAAFQDVGISMTELLSVPNQLRGCLERCLAEDPTPRNLERYLPEIRNTIVALLQGLKSKQAIYKNMREEKRRATTAEAALPALPARQQSREEEARARMRYERQGSSRSEQERDWDAERARALERERERKWERERAAASAASSSAGSSSYYGGSREELTSGGSIGTAGGRATPDLNGEDDRWIPPQNQGRYMNQFAVASESNNHQARYDANGLPLLPNLPTRYSSATATHSLGPAVHITQGSGSSPALVSGAATATDAERPFSTSSTLSSEGSTRSTTSGGNGSSQYPAAPGAPATRRFQGSGRHVHGSPLPPAPADAFRPARRVPSGPSVRRHGSRDERGSDHQLNPEPSAAERAPSPIREEQPVQEQPATLRRQRPSFSGTDGAGLVKRHSLVDISTPQISDDRDSHHDAAAASPTLPIAAFESNANLTLQQNSDTNFSSTSNSVCQPEDASVSPLPTVIIAPSPPRAPAPLVPSQALPPPSPPPPPSVADQTLSALRRGDKSISRRASQRYSTYQIGKIMDSDGVSGSGGGSMKRRPSEIGLADMLAGGSDSGGSSAGPSPGRPQRASRAMPIPPVPALPAGLVGSSPLRGGASGRGFVPSVEEIPESPGGQTARADESVPLSGSSLVPGGSPSQGGLLTPPNPGPVPLPSTQTSPSGAFVAATRPETITLFLLHGRECKKVHVPPDPSVPAIRLLFMEKFGFTAEGAEFPAIYVRDPRTEWRYEWEDGEDLEDGVQLSLNVEPLDQVKAHIDGQISSLARTFETLIRDSISPLSTQFAALQAVQQQAQVRPTPRPLSIVQQQTTRTSPAASPLEEADTATAASATSSPASQPATFTDAAPSPSTVTVATAASSPTAGASVVSAALVNAIRTQFDEAQHLRRELGVLRQVHADGMAAVKETFARVRAENRRLQDLAKTTAALGGGRAFVEAGKTKIDEQSQDVLRRIEDLGDILDDLRADVTSKEVVPKPSIMRSLKKDIVLAKEELEALRKSTDAAATTWRTTWEAEMQNVMAEESMLRHHLALVVDIQEDYTGLKEVFDQIELYVATKGPPTPSVVGRGRGYRSPSPMDIDPAASLSSVFSEIQGAQIDPSKRLRAIESAQRMREREKAAKDQGGGNVLAAQLSEFVDGRKLRKTGGVEETERLRQRRNELALRGGHPPRQQPSTSSSSSSPTMARAPSVREGGESGEGGGEPSSVSPSVSATAEAGPANGSNSEENTPTTPATPNTEAPPQPPPLTAKSLVDVGKKEEADEGVPTAATDAEARSGGGESEEGEGEAVDAKEDEGLA